MPQIPFGHPILSYIFGVNALYVVKIYMEYKRDEPTGSCATMFLLLMRWQSFGHTSSPDQQSSYTNTGMCSTWHILTMSIATWCMKIKFWCSIIHLGDFPQSNSSYTLHEPYQFILLYIASNIFIHDLFTKVLCQGRSSHCCKCARAPTFSTDNLLSWNKGTLYRPKIVHTHCNTICNTSKACMKYVW